MPEATSYQVTSGFWSSQTLQLSIGEGCLVSVDDISEKSDNVFINLVNKLCRLFSGLNHTRVSNKFRAFSFAENDDDCYQRMLSLNRELQKAEGVEIINRFETDPETNQLTSNYYLNIEGSDSIKIKSMPTNFYSDRFKRVLHIQNYNHLVEYLSGHPNHQQIKAKLATVMAGKFSCVEELGMYADNLVNALNQDVEEFSVSSYYKDGFFCLYLHCPDHSRVQLRNIPMLTEEPDDRHVQIKLSIQDNEEYRKSALIHLKKQSSLAPETVESVKEETFEALSHVIGKLGPDYETLAYINSGFYDPLKAMICLSRDEAYYDELMLQINAEASKHGIDCVKRIKNGNTEYRLAFPPENGERKVYLLRVMEETVSQRPVVKRISVQR